MNLKHLLSISSISFAMVLCANAESTVTVTGVHNCCKSCATGITKAVTSVPGATATIDKSTVTISAKSDADAKKAAAALVKAGYYGSGAEAPAPASDAKVKSASVSGVHLCCGKCVTAFNEAVTEVGAKSDATKGAKSVKVEGDFSPKDLQTAMNKHGFNGEIK